MLFTDQGKGVIRMSWPWFAVCIKAPCKNMKALFPIVAAIILPGLATSQTVAAGMGFGFSSFLKSPADRPRNLSFMRLAVSSASS